MVTALMARDNKYWNLTAASTSGHTVYLYLADIETHVAAIPEDTTVITINLGANDYSSGYSQWQYPGWVTWYRAVIDAMHAKAPNAKIGLAIAWRRGYNADADLAAGYIAEVVQGRPWAYVGIDERVILQGVDDGVSETNANDGIHPTTAVYAVEANAWITIMGL